MYLSAVNLIILLNFIPQSNSNNIPLILFNNDKNGINIEFLEKNNTIIAESTSKVYETDYKIRSVDYNLNEKYLIWSCIEYPYPIYCAEYKNKTIYPDKIKFRVSKLSILSRKNPKSTYLAVDWIHNLVYYFKPNYLVVTHIFLIQK